MDHALFTWSCVFAFHFVVLDCTCHCRRPKVIRSITPISISSCFHLILFPSHPVSVMYILRWQINVDIHGVLRALSASLARSSSSSFSLQPRPSMMESLRVQHIEQSSSASRTDFCYLAVVSVVGIFQSCKVR
jgi:hypothetical protein